MKTFPTSFVVALGGMGLLLISVLVQSNNPTALICLDAGIRELSGALPFLLARIIPLAYLPLLPVLALTWIISSAVSDRDRAPGAYLAAVLGAALLFRSPIDIFVATIALALIFLRHSWFSIVPALFALFVDRAVIAPIAILALGIFTCKDRNHAARLFAILLGYSLIALVFAPPGSLTYGTVLSDSFLGFASPDFHGRIGAAALIVTALLLAYLRNSLQVSALLATSAMLYLWGEQYAGFLAATFIYAALPANQINRFGTRRAAVGVAAIALVSLVIVRDISQTNELEQFDTALPVFVGVGDYCAAKRAGLTPVTHVAFGLHGKALPNSDYSTLMRGGSPALEVLDSQKIDSVIANSGSALFQTLRLAPEWATTKEGVRSLRSHFGATRSVQRTLFERKSRSIQHRKTNAPE